MPSLVPSKAREEKIFHVVKWQRMAEKGKFFEITMIGGVTLSAESIFHSMVTSSSEKGLYFNFDDVYAIHIIRFQGRSVCWILCHLWRFCRPPPAVNVIRRKGISSNLYVDLFDVVSFHCHCKRKYYIRSGSDH